ncbi:gem-associated protein 5-like isoform X2 [Adelges cooleyi]|nr:gem-associated protein 5-like isoform X2 [Adelges cooleyi]XP_050440259.1 gem-associated protein 5-like isoform X2 [Adelges cooleyi]
MNTFEITQSSNWYKSNVMTMDKYGTLLAYGSRTVVVLVKGLNGNSIYDLQYSRLRFNAKVSSGRIGAVSFSHETDTHEDAYYLASIDEVNIYIWKVKNTICEHVYSLGSKKNKNIGLLDIVWLYGCLTVVAISDAGSLHKWDVQALKMRNYTLDLKLSPLTLAACPHKTNLIAIGCKSGSVIVYDVTGDGRVLHKLRYHERNVVSLAWCPVSHNPLTLDKSSQPLLLASTACDRTGLYICRAGTDMYCEVTVPLPMRPMRKTIFKNKTNLVWSCIKWIQPTSIIVTSGFGEILKVDFQLNKDMAPVITLINDMHKDVIFSIASPVEASKPYLWSSCMGRKLIRTPLFDTSVNGELPLEIPTLGGFVYCFALSPVNSADFAFGLGDGKMYYWNVSNRRQLELITLSHSVDAKVLSLAFHPSDEGLLAFGTSDGRVGIFNLTKKRNNMNLLKTVLAHSIYRLCWAPPPDTDITHENKYSLYAVGNGQILIYNEMSLWKDPHNLKEFASFNHIEDKLVTPVKRIEMAWKPSYDTVAIGNSNGSIYLLDGRTLKLKHVVLGHDQSVECIIWHPTHVTCDFSEESKFKNYFASCSHSIKVHKLEEDGTPVLVAEFNGHKEKINELAWSPHRNLLLLSCSNDFTAKIWDVQKCALIGVYSKHLCTVLCGMFSPLDSDIVFTGSADHSIHSWRVSKDLQNDVLATIKTNPTIIKKKSDTEDLDNLSQTGNINANNKEPTNRKQQFPLSSYDLFMGKYLENAVDMYLSPNNEVDTSQEVNYLSFFGSTEKMRKLMVEESKSLKKKMSAPMVPCLNNINIWGHNLESYLNDAIDTKTINDWMIAVAPSISYELWLKMCAAYAFQLEDAGEVTKSSTFLVALKKYSEAALMLLKNNLFREALAIARCQEKQDDELIFEITKKWAEYNVYHGHPKEAAHCYLSIKDPWNAVSCLTKIKQPKELILAAKLASRIDEDMELSLVVNLLKTEYFKHHKWNEARALLKDHPKLNYLEMWVGVHELLFELGEKTTYEVVKNWIFNINNEDKYVLLDHILKKITWKPEFYDKLINTVEPEFILDTNLVMPKMTIFIAGQFCLMALQYIKTGKITIDSQKCLIKCFAAAYDYEIAFPDSISKFNKPLSKIMMWFFPKGPLSADNFKIFEHDDNLKKTIKAYICYACFSWLKPLFTSLSKKIKLSFDNKDEDSKQLQHLSDILALMKQYRELINTYILDIMDIETSNFFKAKNEIERIDCLLSSSVTNSENNLEYGNTRLNSSNINANYQKSTEDTNGHIGSKNTLEINPSKFSEDDKSTNHKKMSDTFMNLDSNIINNNDKLITNGITNKSVDLSLENSYIPNMNDLLDVLATEIYPDTKEFDTFFQSLTSVINKFQDLDIKCSVQHIAHFEMEASRKRNLENIVSDFQNKRVNAPNPLKFLNELQKTVSDLYNHHKDFQTNYEEQNSIAHE